MFQIAEELAQTGGEPGDFSQFVQFGGKSVTVDAQISRTATHKLSKILYSAT